MNLHRALPPLLKPNSFPIIESVEARPLNVPLIDPFIIASARVDHVENAAVRVRFDDGTVGFGEAPTLHPVTIETQATALEALARGSAFLTGQTLNDWPSLFESLKEALPNFASARTGLEMALLDALTKRAGLSLHNFFGAHSTRIKTDITVPICSAEKAYTLASKDYRHRFQIIKVKVGKNLDEDIQRMLAIHRGHPKCQFVVDANEGFTADEALRFLKELTSRNLPIRLFEQPVHRDNWDGFAKVHRETNIPIAADESCRGVADAKRLCEENLADVLNIKLVKQGFLEALGIVELARIHNKTLMIGGMVETRLAMGVSACFAAGLGGFEWIDLDTPYLLATDPIVGGYQTDGGENYDLSSISLGHGAQLTFPTSDAWF